MTGYIPCRYTVPIGWYWKYLQILPIKQSTFGQVFVETVLQIAKFYTVVKIAYELTFRTVV